MIPSFLLPFRSGPAPARDRGPSARCDTQCWPPYWAAPYLAASPSLRPSPALDATQGDGWPLHLRAGQLLAGQDEGEADRHFRAAVDARPDSAAGWTNYGAQLVEWRRLARAVSALTRATECVLLSPSHVAACKRVALTWEYHHLPSQARPDGVGGVEQPGPRPLPQGRHGGCGARL